MTAVTDAWTDPTGATLDKTTGDIYTELVHDSIVGNELYLYRRRVVELTNKSGGGVIAGDVVIIDTTTNSSFTTTTTASDPLAIGVAMETIANNAAGKIAISGIAQVLVTATTTRGDWIVTSSTVKQALPTATRLPGAFARAVDARTGSGLVNCLLFGHAEIPAVIVINRDVSVAEVVSSTTETTVYTYTVPGGMLGTTRALRLSLIGDVLNDSGSNDTISVRVKYGGTVIGGDQLTMSDSASGNRVAVYLDCLLQAAGATNAQRSRSIYALGGDSLGSAANPPAIGGGRYSQMPSVLVNNALAIDSTADQALIVTIEHTVNHASASFKCHTVSLELLP